MDNIETIKSYLVSLGFSVDNNKYAQFQQHLNRLDRLVQSQTTGMMKNVAKAAGGIVAAYAAVVSGTVALVAHTAKADMEFKTFATRMWMTTSVAKNFKLAIDNMGYSLQDIAFNPELRAQFFDLVNLSAKLQKNMPTDYESSMKGVRSFLFMFKQAKVEVAYSSQWISYYLLKNFAGPLQTVREYLQKLNERIITNMPIWTKKVADFLTGFINIGTSAFKFFGGIFKGVKEFFDRLPKWAKIAALGVASAFLIMQINPWIAGITALLLLIDDFMGYMDGRKSSKTLAPFWQSLINMFNDLKENGTIKSLNDTFEMFSKTLKYFGDAAGNAINWISKLFGLMTGEKAKKSTGYWSIISKEISAIIKPINTLIDSFLRLIDVISLVAQGKFKEAGQVIADAFKGFEMPWSKLRDNYKNNNNKGVWDKYISPFLNWEFNPLGLFKSNDKSVNLKGLKPNATGAIDSLSQFYYAQTGQKLNVTSGYRNWGNHTTGEKFDVADSLLQSNKGGIRDKMMDYAKSLGLSVLDEYKHPSKHATGGHLDFNAAGFRNNDYTYQPAGTSGQSSMQVELNIYAQSADASKVASMVDTKLKQYRDIQYYRSIRDAQGNMG